VEDLEEEETGLAAQEDPGDPARDPMDLQEEDRVRDQGVVDEGAKEDYQK